MISSNLCSSDLIIDETYGGSRNGNASDDPLPQLLGIDNGTGFRHLGKRPSVKTLKLLALQSNLAEINWSDSINRECSLFTYYVDKRDPADLHDTPSQDNLILQNLFNEAHSQQTRDHFPRIFLFGNRSRHNLGTEPKEKYNGNT